MMATAIVYAHEPDTSIQTTIPSASRPDVDDEKVGGFLLRCGLRRSAIARAHEFAVTRFPGHEVVAAPFQGYCSYTLLLLARPPDARRRDSGCEVERKSSRSTGSVDETCSWEACQDWRLVQFRPRRHGIDVGVCAEARKILLALGVVPEVEDLGMLTGLEMADGGKGELCGYAIERVDGVSLTDLRKVGAFDVAQRRMEVVRDLAKVFAETWKGRRDGEAVVRGKVGGSLRWRLEIMVEGLPREFRAVARRVAGELEGIERLPWVITHGDLVPDNIMVRTEGVQAGGLVGLIDWAEAEWLPFGVGLYGLEEVLGEDVPVDDGYAAESSSRFEYYPEAEYLRALFWEAVGTVVKNEEIVRKAKSAQVLGVLLWRGIAFDDGALGRVVESERDWWDVQRLRAWLFDRRGLGIVPPSERWWEKVWRDVWGWIGRCVK
ncbi:uncharacterized protein CTRU02_212692 [Colletotrichum truncatum]|uniref:Uncharacterized protein n=1 Tax=Colletotrichum truncatum TaxID=5467 RepID=A0ACC3YIS2_COLTU|nr:uncharacterized protein CTRU02_05234 [Colletotrichum truncatum]KAF6794402.1 hypothetical protein CTRU02_05234 [Colletotrichum truncatum]